MTQADSMHSTPPTNTPADTTRRHLLTIAAGAVAAAIPTAVLAAAPDEARDKDRWRCDLVHDDKHRSWHFFLMEHVATALAKAVA